MKPLPKASVTQNVPDNVQKLMVEILQLVKRGDYSENVTVSALVSLTAHIMAHRSHNEGMLLDDLKSVTDGLRSVVTSTWVDNHGGSEETGDD